MCSLCVGTIAGGICWKSSRMVRFGTITVVAPAFFPRSPTPGFLFILTNQALPTLRTGNILKFCGFPTVKKNWIKNQPNYIFLENGGETFNTDNQKCKKIYNLQVQSFEIISCSGPWIQKEDGGSWPSFVSLSAFIDIL